MWGPNSSVIRLDSERLARRRKYAPTDGWEWVDDILCQFPELGHLKAHERIEHDASCKITLPTQNNVQTVRGIAENTVNRPECHPVEHTLWFGTGVFREPAVLDLEPYFNPDQRYTPQLRGGMPGRRFPTEDSGSPKILVHGSARN